MFNYRGLYYILKSQLIGSLKSKEAVFFSIFLPPLLFVIFGLAFRVDGEYAKFFLPGMIGSIFVSDALLAVGPIIKNYYTLKIVRYFRGYPLSISWLFVSFILTRLFFVMVSSLILIILSTFIFDYTPNLFIFARYVIGMILGFSIYSLIALTISFYGIEDNKDQGILSILFFMSIFLSDAFFVLSKVNVAFDVVGYFFPLRIVLDFMRGNDLSIIYCLLWLVFSFVIFYYRIRRIELKRY